MILLGAARKSGEGGGASPGSERIGPIGRKERQLARFRSIHSAGHCPARVRGGGEAKEKMEHVLHAMYVTTIQIYL